MEAPEDQVAGGLSLAPFRALRPQVDAARLARLLCPPYDVIDAAKRSALLQADAENAVGVVLPEPTPAGYAAAGERLAQWVRSGLWAVDSEAAIFVYEMVQHGRATRGLVGAVQLRDAEDGVILPHENTMAGPVADRLTVMTSTGADLEPIYLVYDGGGAASDAVRAVDSTPPIATANTPDGIAHRLWAITDGASHRAINDDLAGRRALIADGHHRYATYQERQRLCRASHGPGPWDRGLALLVDSSDYGPQVHAIHRFVRNLSLASALKQLEHAASVRVGTASPEEQLQAINDYRGFAAVLSDGVDTAVVTDADGTLRRSARGEHVGSALAALDVSVVHRGLVERVWKLSDDVDTVGYAHSVEEALEQALAHQGFAILLRPTPIDAVAAVAAAGARMPRKSTLFTPKPASGLLIRRLADQV